MSAPFYQNTTMRLINKRLTPLTIGNLTRLASLLLNLYELSGNIPSILANCQTLNVLSLESNKFTGGIPKEIFSISTLSINLGLAHNLLTGSIPSEVGTMRNLAKIDVRMNKLSGEIPSSLGERQELEQIYLGGNFFHGSIPSSLRALKGDNLVGVGSFGSVYKGRLDDNSTSVVAVKVLNLHQRGASKSFMRECEALRNIRHRNLVMILTACSSVDFRGNEFKAMVFEFMANGSLDHWLHPAPNEQGETKELTLIERINIATDIAYALDYLHHLSKLDILPSC